MTLQPGLSQAAVLVLPLVRHCCGLPEGMAQLGQEWLEQSPFAGSPGVFTFSYSLSSSADGLVKAAQGSEYTKTEAIRLP